MTKQNPVGHGEQRRPAVKWRPIPLDSQSLTNLAIVTLKGSQIRASIKYKGYSESNLSLLSVLAELRAFSHVSAFGHNNDIRREYHAYLSSEVLSWKCPFSFNPSQNFYQKQSRKKNPLSVKKRINQPVKTWLSIPTTLTCEDLKVISGFYSCTNNSVVTAYRCRALELIVNDLNRLLATSDEKSEENR